MPIVCGPYPLCVWENFEVGFETRALRLLFDTFSSSKSPPHANKSELAHTLLIIFDSHHAIAPQPKRNIAENHSQPYRDWSDSRWLKSDRLKSSKIATSNRYWFRARLMILSWTNCYDFYPNRRNYLNKRKTKGLHHQKCCWYINLVLWHLTPSCLAQCSK